MYCWRQSSRPIEKKQNQNNAHSENGDNYNSVIHKYRSFWEYEYNSLSGSVMENVQKIL